MRQIVEDRIYDILEEFVSDERENPSDKFPNLRYMIPHILASLWVNVEAGLPTGETNKTAWLVKYSEANTGRVWDVYHASRTGDQMAHLIKIALNPKLIHAIAWMEIPPITEAS